MLFQKRKGDQNQQESIQPDLKELNFDNDPEIKPGIIQQRNFEQLMSPTQKDSLHNFESNPINEVQKFCPNKKNQDTAFFQKSTKFDSIPLVDENKSGNEDIYEEDFEDEPIEEVHSHENEDDMDKNMELPIPEISENQRYQHTFGEPSEQSYTEVSNMNPMEESEYSKGIIPKGTRFDNSQHQYGNLAEMPEIKSGSDLNTEKNITNVFKYQPPEDTSNEKDFQMSFRFQKKEMENLNNENVVFTSQGKFYS